MRYLLITLSLLLMLVSPAQAEEIGKVIAARGEAYAVSPSGERRELKRRSVVIDGDTLFTGEEARLQIRFADGTLLALRPESEYRIDSYQFNEGEEDENFSTLLKGGFRTITGVISKKDPDAYQVETPVATIGVRGTNYETALTERGLDIAAWQGGVKVSTRAGVLDIGAGQDFNFATVGAPDARPQGMLQPPSSMSGPLIESGAPSGPDAEAEGEESVINEQTQSSDESTDTAVQDSAATEGMEQGAADTEFAEGASEGDLTGTLSGGETDSSLDDSGLIADIGFDGGITGGIVTEDPTFTVVEPITTVGDFIDTIAVNDKRLDPHEWEKLFADGYGGLFVFGGQGSNNIQGGRALSPGGTSDPVLTHTHVEPYDDVFTGVTVDTVYRRGMAALNGMGTVAVGNEQVYWGIWNGTATPIDKLTNPANPLDVTAVHEPMFWIVGRPQDPLRTDVAVYNFVDTFHGGGSLGLLTPGDVTQFSMNINFATGAVTNGVLDITKTPDNWNVLFNGDIRGPFVYLNIQNGSLINATDPILGDMGGFMTGSNGQALIGAFDLRDAGNASNHIEGIFILRE